jgi:hypothetical protein
VSYQRSTRSQEYRDLLEEVRDRASGVCLIGVDIARKIILQYIAIFYRILR